ncbi:L-lactate dehydrogenase [Geomonas sp. Red32]|uniref:L-lactate dehydrogenase n=1 Tax=Geomonas sp. Red32 TaxID=2912856 RepID=UPI00202CEC66|nr:L-lactate dehydrogenase [Geomonas sp. Red32]MCM0080049.1 L-lactate dehydrogenase [Geomonas sp. Red32]
MKVAIIGAGHIGTTLAYTLLIKGFVSEIAIVNRTREKAFGEALDMTHALASASHSVKIYSGDYRACEGAEVVVVTAGAATVKGQSRLEIVAANAAIFRELIPSILEHNRDAIFLVVTNPVDVNTWLALRYSGLPWQRIIGSGTVLDCQRFQSFLSRHFNVHPANVQGLIIGEHGDSMIPLWSRASICGIPLAEFPGYDQQEMEDIFDITRRGAAMVRVTKDSTQYATAMSVARAVEAILLDKKEVLTVSTLVNDFYGIGDVCLSMPAVVGKRGIERVLKPQLADDERDKLLRSAAILKGVLASVGEDGPAGGASGV